jgi:hypothetical protein
MADVTREEFDALAHRVDALDGGVKPDKPVDPPVVVVPPVSADGVSLSKLTVSSLANNFSLSGIAKASGTTTFAHLQIAVRGPGAADLSFHDNFTLPAGGGVKLAAANNYGQAGEYTAWLAYTLDGTNWVDGPVTSFKLVDGAKPATGARRVPLAGKSKLPFNSIVFRQSPAEAEAFGAKRGVPIDGLLTFTPRQSWGDFRSGFDGWADYMASGHICVVSMPHAPQTEGDQMNQKGANDGYRDQQRSLGKDLAAMGLNQPWLTIRVDWELNGNWYPWSANRPGGAEASKLAQRNYIINLRAGGLTKANFGQCFNKGPSQAGADFSTFPGAEYVGNIGVDQYDMWSPSFNDNDWAGEQRKVPSIGTAIAFAKKNGIMWSWDEGGNTHSGASQGGDNPFYWQKVKQTIMADLDTCAWHNTYDNAGAPADLHHDFDSNPKSWDAYKQLFRP